MHVPPAHKSQCTQQYQCTVWCRYSAPLHTHSTPTCTPSCAKYGHTDNIPQCTHIRAERAIGLQQKPENGVFDSRVKVVSMLPHVGVSESMGELVSRYTCRSVCTFARGVTHRTIVVWIRCHATRKARMPPRVVSQVPVLCL